MNIKPIRIALLGDSWGMPNYYGQAGPPCEHHIEWLLKYHDNHVVTNFARNGGSNMLTLKRLSNAFDIGYKCDLVIWLHTEPLRDTTVNDVQDYTLLDLNLRMTVRSYKFAQLVKYKSECKWLVIGGQAPLNKDIFDKFQIADFVKYDWRSELVGKQLPESPAWARQEFLESPKWVDSIETKNHWLEKHLEVRTALEQSQYFPDNAHPGSEAHELLYNWINKEVLGKM